ncbi:hypothetical protein A2W24_06745 [Microgenomates group bacterium RBG_16_45_19]|nr:MAG: hypothetical protein A2W24_06745 [Microgenomates group bacterium RBG_16_45_19]
MDITTISTKGQVTIPDSIRQELNIKAGDKAFFSLHNPHTQEIRLKIIKHHSLNELAGSLHRPGLKYDPNKEETWV